MSILDTVRTRILTVPDNAERRENVNSLVKRVQNSVVHVDKHREGVRHNFANALAHEWETAMAEPRRIPTHRWVIVVQDDAELCEGFERNIAGALMCAPADAAALGLFHFGSYGSRAIAKGKPYMTGYNAIWGTMLAVRYSGIPQILAVNRFADEMGWAPNNDDGLVAAAANIGGYKNALTSRAMCTHKDFRSTLGHHMPRPNPAATVDTVPDTAAVWSRNTKAAAIGTNAQIGPIRELVSAFVRCRAEQGVAYPQFTPAEENA